MNRHVLDMLHEARRAEKGQALFYRALAAAAEAIPDTDLSERLNGLHADEQHHLSRLTVRLVELGEAVPDLGGMLAPAAPLDGWELQARRREHAEMQQYSALLEQELDTKTRMMIEQFVAAERSHADMLGGKFMGAQPW